MQFILLFQNDTRVNEKREIKTKNPTAITSDQIETIWFLFSLRINKFLLSVKENNTITFFIFIPLSVFFYL